MATLQLTDTAAIDYRLFDINGANVAVWDEENDPCLVALEAGTYWLISDDMLMVTVERVTVIGDEVERAEVAEFAQGFDTKDDVQNTLAKRVDIPAAVFEAIRLIPVS